MINSSDKSRKPHGLLDGLGSYYPMTPHPLDPFTNQVSVWNRLLTKKEIAELYWAGYPPFERFIKRRILYPIKLVGRFLKRIW